MCVEIVDGFRVISYISGGVGEKAMRSFACSVLEEGSLYEPRRVNGAGAGKPTSHGGGGVGGPEEDADDDDEGLRISGGSEWIVLVEENRTRR